MSQHHALTRAQRTTLIRALIDMSDDNNHIAMNIAGISSKLEELLGRTISDLTTRCYLKDAGFTWEQNRCGGRGRQSSRARELAACVLQVMDLCGVDNAELIAKVRHLASHKAM